MLNYIKQLNPNLSVTETTLDKIAKGLPVKVIYNEVSKGRCFTSYKAESDAPMEMSGYSKPYRIDNVNGCLIAYFIYAIDSGD
jgi:hypothetical protein